MRVEDPSGRRIRSAGMIRRSQVARSVRTLLVEVADVHAEDVLELTAADDQELVEALPAQGCRARSFLVRLPPLRTPCGDLPQEE
jgi:hypothetical protein